MRPRFRAETVQVGSVGSVGSVEELRWSMNASLPKDREDVRNILAVQGARLDWSHLDHWTTEHATTLLLADIRASLPQG
jgi:hypothetical protein